MEVNDVLFNSIPLPILKSIHQRKTKAIAESDKCDVSSYRNPTAPLTQLRRELLDGLNKIGFRHHWGQDDAGFLFMAMVRGGGYYLGM